MSYRHTKVRPGHPLEVTVTLTPKDAVAVLNTVVYGGKITFDGDLGRTRGGKSVRLTIVRKPLGIVAA